MVAVGTKTKSGKPNTQTSGETSSNTNSAKALKVLIADIEARTDGFNIWDVIATNAPSPRTEILHNIDPLTKQGALRVGAFKLIVGVTNGAWGPNLHPKRAAHSAFLSTTALNEDPEDKGSCLPRGCLYNITADPQERTNLIEEVQYASVLQSLTKRYAELNAATVPCLLCGAKADPAAQPKNIPGLEVCTEGVCRKMGVWAPWVSSDEE